jgi:hypothetical protein
VGHNWIGILQPKDTSKPAQSGGCAQCHPGNGQKPNPPDKLGDADFQNIDCLLCHAPDYRRTVVKDGDKFRFAPAEGVDLLKSAQGVRRPTNEMCLRCHLATGGGPNHKHGVTPTKESDVHLAKGMQCVDCHTTREHRTAGGSDVKAQDLPEVRIDCANCHKDNPHKGEKAEALGRHLARVACQTCHIPAIARDPKFPTIVARDWTRPVLNDKTGLYGPTNTPAGNVKPEYRWWNRMMATPPEPVGSLADPASKLTPWKKTDYTVIADAASGKPVFIKAGTYAVTGDPGAAAKKGAEDAKQEYGGQWKGVTETMVFSVNHQVAPKEQALTCTACHTAAGILDWKALGYPEERIKALTAVR